MDRVAIFIDGSNFYHGCKNNLPAGFLVNFERFALKLAGRRHLVRVYFYTAVVRRQDGEQRFRISRSFSRSFDTLSTSRSSSAA